MSEQAANDRTVPPTIVATGLDEPEPGDAGPAPRWPDRYEDLGSIAGGGCGDVRRVRDRLLSRVLAMKVLRWEHVGDPRMRARFLAEAELTAQLQHPGIVAVHDRGELPDGRPWFTMKEVRGRTLDAVIEEIHAAAGPEGFRPAPPAAPAPSRWTFRRALDAFARIAQAVGYAHGQGVVHRDLKPQNLMVGELGEVLVMDWGLARRLREPAAVSSARGVGSAGGEIREGAARPGARAPEPTIAPPASVRPEGLTVLAPPEAGGERTRHGDVLGTPAYMPPEQARGQLHLHGEASDVYALGAILYHLLTGRPPYRGSGEAIWRQVMAGPPPPVAEAARGGPPVPEELCAICARAMQREIEDRYPDAEALAQELFAWLDGARRREQALAALAEAEARRPGVAALRAEAERRAAEARAALEGVRPFDEVARKRAGWALEDEAARLGREAALREAEWLQAVHGALSLDPELPEAHLALADHYRERLARAERERRGEDAAHAEALLRAHDRGRHAAFLRGDGALTLLTDPPGAEVTLLRYEERDRRLVPVVDRALGRTPLREVPVGRGSCLLQIRAPGRAEVRYPVLIERGGRWDGRAPPGEGAEGGQGGEGGEGEPRPVPLPPEDELGPDEVYVPAGWCAIGGDPEAADSLPAQRLWLEGFVIRRFPVTNREYLAFLNDLVAQGREREAFLACPRSQLGMSEDTDARLVFTRDAAGRFVIGGDESSPVWDPEWPVVLVDWYAAAAYARWLAERTGRPWRLPGELEREKAARGVDGRAYPWGDHPDATFACVVESYAREPARARVDSFPADESPYGVRGLAGNARDWCLNPWRRGGPPVAAGRASLDPAAPEDPVFRAVRGGAWGSPLDYARSCARFGNRPTARRTNLGLRVARSWPPPGS